MVTIEKSIDVEAPLEQVYEEWTQFEQFPMFMEAVHDVRHLDDRRLVWRGEVMGRIREWRAEITEQMPNRRIAWASRSGAPIASAVSLQSLAPGRTRVKL